MERRGTCWIAYLVKQEGGREQEGEWMYEVCSSESESECCMQIKPYDAFGEQMMINLEVLIL